jgi:uncharacterized protein
VRVARHLDGQSFLQAARAWLLRAEAENNLILGNSPAIGASRQAGTAPYLACVYDDSEIVGCAMRTPPHKLVITHMPLSAVTALVEDVAAFYGALPGVSGPDACVAAFAGVWSKRSGERTTRTGRQRIYQIERVTGPSRVAPGALRLARESDASLLASWIAAFAAEATPDDRVDAAEAARHRITHGMLSLWEDPDPVSMAAWSGKTPNGVRINLVYTPPSLRGRGYATTCVGDLTRRLLEQGNRFCFLFTDLANPTSNSIYQQLGYRPVCDTASYAFMS